tara:strand:- start:410 stop:532 length:123 start_codon:yes stop_codon:yes gene_type:complete
MVLLKKIKDIILWPYVTIRDHIRYKKKLKKLREQDPFIYK